MYCTPIGNYSFIRKTTSQKTVEQIQEKTNQTKNKTIDTNVTKLNNKTSSYSANSYKGLWGCGIVKNGLDK
jgi:hypothetical protein